MFLNVQSKISMKMTVSQFVQPVVLMSVLLGVGATTAIAQVAEVPRPNANGDYRTAMVQGNRGMYPNRKWLVTDSSDLNCRVSPNGVVRSQIVPGAIVTAQFAQGDAIVLQNGSPWLRVRGTDALAFPVRGQSLGTCFVRANVRYVAPINEDAIRSGATN